MFTRNMPLCHHLSTHKLPPFRWNKKMAVLQIMLIYLTVLMTATTMMLQMVAASPNDLVHQDEADVVVTGINI